MRFWRRLLTETEGTTAVEYAVMLALILIGIIGTIGSVGAQTGGIWTSIKTNLTNAGFGS